MRIALIAHDKKKDALVKFTKIYENVLKELDLVGTGTTAQRIMDATHLEVKKFKSGPLGGDQQIGALIPEKEIDMIIFFRDPLTAQAHEPDISALLRLCDVYEVPLATNPATAKMLIEGIVFEEENKEFIVK
ncbi:methylglyoxal synthase [uncultured Clostridium sp.]|uniref:methylglyoxal synthase n=1 Tax=uncultured Clostridium sp. TaxID=59620 RepID=UPI002635CCF0|nr:methylglyoxal synthase [uncultured Clostridium sp.]